MTFCEFVEVSECKISSLKISFKSKYNSAYYFTEEGVYRYSNHWGRVGDCRWRLISKEVKVNQHQRIGYANWFDFYPNNETEKLFYIEIDWKMKSVIFQHKNNPNFNNEILRNASETAKRIQQIKDVLKNDSWLKYLEVDDLEAARKEICNQLITTNKSLIEIKQHYK